MLTKFQPNQSYSLTALNSRQANGRATESDVRNMIALGDASIAEKDRNIKAFTASIPLMDVAGMAELPLRGLPVGAKDIIDTSQMPTQLGSPIYEGYRPRADATIIRLVKRAGGQVTHKTVTTEFAFLHPNKTCNPHNPLHTPGGSSSGSAAAVASGMLPFAIGTQTGGSIIRPAAYCGTFGFKPSFGALPTIGVKTFSWSLDTLGLYAPSLPDMHLFWSALTQSRQALAATSRPLSIGVLKQNVWDEASTDAHEAIAKATDAFSASGAEVTELAWQDLFSQAFDAHKTIHDYEGYRALAWELDEHRDKISPILMACLKEGPGVSRAAYLEAQAIAANARRAFAKLQDTVDVLVTPSAPGAAPETLNSTGTSIFNRFLTLMGVPCIHMPAYQNESALPVGFQIVGKSEQDDELLSLANYLWRLLQDC